MASFNFSCDDTVNGILRFVCGKGYIGNLKKNLKDLTREMEDLNAIQRIVKNKVATEEEIQHRQRLETVKVWLTRVEDVHERFTNLREQEQGKINSVLLHMRNTSGLEIENSIAHIEKIIDSNRKEFLEHVLMDGLSDLPKPCKEIHMSCCQVFEMFFNKKNRYDSDTEMLQDIKKAFYDPVNVKELSEIEPKPPMVHGDEFLMLPLLMNLSPKILEFKRKDEYGAVKTSMCLRRSFGAHKRAIALQPLKIVALQRIVVPVMPAKSAPCFY